MSHIRNVVTITEYLLLSVLALSTGCLAAAIDYNNYYATRSPFWERYFSTKRYIWEDWEDYTVPPSFLRDDPPGRNDTITFFIVFFVGGIVISLLTYFAFCHPTSSTSSSSSDAIRRPVAGAVIHPPPMRGNLPTTPRAPVNYPFHTPASYTNAAFVTDGRPGDAPPDYAAVALGDLTSTNKVFPVVKPVETPPPQYQNNGKPFK